MSSRAGERMRARDCRGDAEGRATGRARARRARARVCEEGSYARTHDPLGCCHDGHRQRGCVARQLRHTEGAPPVRLAGSSRLGLRAPGSPLFSHSRTMVRIADGAETFRPRRTCDCARFGATARQRAKRQPRYRERTTRARGPIQRQTGGICGSALCPRRRRPWFRVGVE